MDAQPSQELRQLIQKVSGGATLTEDEIRTALDQMTAGAATPAQMGAFLMALRVRGETVEEIAGAAQMLRAKMNRVEVAPDAIDIVGTGGDSARHLQYLDLRGAGRGRRRREDRQARQPPRLLQVGRLRRALRARRQARGARRHHRALRRARRASASCGRRCTTPRSSTGRRSAASSASAPSSICWARSAIRPASSARWSACSPGTGWSPSPTC